MVPEDSQALAASLEQLSLQDRPRSTSPSANQPSTEGRARITRDARSSASTLKASASPNAYDAQQNPGSPSASNASTAPSNEPVQFSALQRHYLTIGASGVNGAARQAVTTQPPIRTSRTCILPEVLPGEMRNGIYEEALTISPGTDGTVELVKWGQVRTSSSSTLRRWDSAAGREVRKQPVAALLATCKQVFNEACSIYYYQNHFKISGDDKGLNTASLGHFMLSMRPARSRHLKSLTITVNDFEQTVLAMNTMQQLMGLEELCIIVEADGPVDRFEENKEAFAKAFGEMLGLKTFSIQSSSIDEGMEWVADALGIELG